MKTTDCDCSAPVVEDENGGALKAVAEVLAARFWPRFGQYLVPDMLALCKDAFLSYPLDRGADLYIVSNEPAVDALNYKPGMFRLYLRGAS